MTVEAGSSSGIELNPNDDIGISYSAVPTFSAPVYAGKAGNGFRKDSMVLTYGTASRTRIRGTNASHDSGEIYTPWSAYPYLSFDEQVPTWAFDVKGKLLGRIAAVKYYSSKIYVMWATDVGQLRP